jgi:hypothetical protein
LNTKFKEQPPEDIFGISKAIETYFSPIFTLEIGRDSYLRSGLDQQTAKRTPL